jgi:hypothetical protein
MHFEREKMVREWLAAVCFKGIGLGKPRKNAKNVKPAELEARTA